MFKQITALHTKLTAIMTLLDHIKVHEDYIEVTIPDNMVITSAGHLAIRTKGKILLNPTLPKNRKLSDHVKLIEESEKKT